MIHVKQKALTDNFKVTFFEMNKLKVPNINFVLYAGHIETVRSYCDFFDIC